jgi:hypothetical protein
MTGGKITTLDTTPQTLFDATPGGVDVAAGPCQAFYVSADANNAADVKVRVEGLQAVGEYFYIAPGEKVPFRLGGNEPQRSVCVTKVTAQMESGSGGKIRFGVVSRF